MAAGVPPPPLNSPSGSYYWLEWYTSLTNFLNGTDIPWSNLNFSGSNITDILTRNHNDLQNIQGGTGTTESDGNHFHMSARGYIASSGTQTGLPSGWSVVHTSAGVYTITTSLAPVVPNISVLATSNTSGVTVQWIDLSAAPVIVVHLSADANFSLIVNT
jgi:hypothetical protein